MALDLLQPRQAADPGRIPGALVCSILVHAAAILAAVWFVSARRDDPAPQQATREEPQRIVWIAMPGPSGGGGGSKAPAPAPPRPVPPPPARAVAQPVPVPAPSETAVTEPEPLEPQPAVPAPLASAAMPGTAMAAAPAPGNGNGGGSGDGDGAGAGRGRDGAFGGGAVRPGNGVTSPVPITRASPAYTSDAMRARAQGIITVECVVEPNGECGDVRVVRAFAPPFGLDQQALAAARRWRFRPGMRGGEPVPVLVNLEIEFNIR
jgi:protein TonB